MSPMHDGDEALTALLRQISFPEPTPDLLAGARRRYVEAVDARYRREVVAGLAAACVALALVALAVTPATLIAWVAVTLADLATWLGALEVLVSLVPPVVSISAVLISVVSLLSGVCLLRARSS